MRHAALLAALLLAATVSACRASVNAWHGAPWHFGYETTQETVE